LDIHSVFQGIVHGGGIRYDARMNIDYLVKFLVRLLETRSPTGMADDAVDLCADEAQSLGFSLERTAKGAGIIRIDGREPGDLRVVSGHVDTLGAMVRSIGEKGTLRITPIGGMSFFSIDGEYCTVHARPGDVRGTILATHTSVHVYEDARKQPREEKNIEVRLDAEVKSRKEVEELGIRPGDFVTFDPRVELTKTGFVKSRHLDDKAGVAVMMALLEHYRQTGEKPLRPTALYVTTFEEVGHGASSIPEGAREFLSVDMGAMGDDLSTDEYGVSICAKDASGPYDRRMTTRLVDLAEELELPFAVDIYPFYGSDASAARRAGHDIIAGLLGPGVHASHSMERTHRKALEATLKLVHAYLDSPPVG
jgi:putative aminopeptidase FrvX